MTNTRRIIKSPGAVQGYLIQSDEQASEIIRPGACIEPGGSADVQNVSTLGAAQPLRVALGGVDGIDPTVLVLTDWTDADGQIAANELVRSIYLPTGILFYGWLADGENVTALETPLEFHDDGSFQIHSGQAVDESGSASYTIMDGVVKAYAMETVDNSGGSNPVRIVCRAA